MDWIPSCKKRCNKFEINEKIYDITQGIQKVLTKTSKIPQKKLNDKDRDTINKVLESPDFENYKAIRGESKSGRYKQSKTKLRKRNLESQGVKIIIPSNIIDIYTKLDLSLGLKLSGHTDTLTDASNLIDELYKRGEIQNKQKYRSVLKKFSNYLY